MLLNSLLKHCNPLILKNEKNPIEYLAAKITKLKNNPGQ